MSHSCMVLPKNYSLILRLTVVDGLFTFAAVNHYHLMALAATHLWKANQIVETCSGQSGFGSMSSKNPDNNRRAEPNDLNVVEYEYLKISEPLI